MYQEIIESEPENAETVKQFAAKMGISLKRMEQLILSIKDGKKENTDPEVRDHYIERNPVLQNQDYGCRWQRVEFVCRNL